MPLDLKNIHALPTLEKYLTDRRYSAPMNPAESPFLSVLRDRVMIFDYSLAALVTAGLLIYLVYALLKPELF